MLVEFEHSEQEAEGEELSMEWEETTFEDKVTSIRLTPNNGTLHIL